MEKTARSKVGRHQWTGRVRGSLGGIFLGIFLLGGACEKFEGEGGSCTLIGKVLVQDYNGAGQLVDEYYAPDERVFIMYGEDSIYNDDTRTNYDGSFRFANLYKGDYRVFAYSECDTCDAPEVPVMASVTFTKNQETQHTADIVIRK
jgi:hypothetical protein